MIGTAQVAAEIDQEAAREQLLAVIHGDDDGQLLLRCLKQKPGAKEGDKDALTNKFYETPAELVTAAATFNAEWDVYIGAMARFANNGGGPDATKDGCRTGRIVWADCDTDDALDALQAFPLPPTYIIESGGLTATERAKQHAWWVLDEPLPKEEIERLLKALIAALGCDRTRCDASSVMRIPGMIHRGEGRPVRFVAVGEPTTRAALEEVTLEALSGARAGVSGGPDYNGRVEAARGLNAALKDPPKGAGSGRSNWLIEISGYLVHKYKSWEKCREKILEHNDSLEAPLLLDELEDTVLISARKYWDKAQAGPEVTPGHEAEMVTKGWRLHSPLVRAEVWGRSPSSPVDLYLQDGSKISIEEIGWTAKVDALCQNLMAQTGGRTAGPIKATRADLLTWQLALWRLAQIQEGHDEVAETVEWVQRFMCSVGEIISDWTLGETAERYAAACALQAARIDPYLAVVPFVIQDRVTLERMFKTTDLQAYIYHIIKVNMSSAKLKERMLRAGYGHKSLEAWPAGYSRLDRVSDRGAKRKVAIFILPAKRSS